MSKTWLGAVERDFEVLDFCGMVPFQAFLDDEALNYNVLTESGRSIADYCAYLNSFAGIVSEVPDIAEEWGMLGTLYTNEGSVDDLVMALVNLVCRTAHLMEEVSVRGLDYNLEPWGKSKILVTLNLRYTFS